MQKIICDLCGKEIKESNNYIIPCIQYDNIEKQGKIIIPKAFKKQSRKIIDLCEKCEFQIAEIFDEIGICE